MPQPKVLARGLLILSLLVALLAAPGVFASSLADEPAPQHSEAASSFVSLPAATGATPEYAGGGKLAAPQPAILPQAATNIVISEFRSKGPGTGPTPTPAADEFIELYNPTGSSITLTNWSIWRSVCGGAATAILDLTPLNITIPAGGHYLIGGLNYSGSVLPDDAINDIGLDDDGGLALRSGLTDLDPIIDQVGMCDSGGFREGTNLAPMVSDANQSYDRNAEIPGGVCTDAGNNSTDFFLRIPSDPQSGASGITICGNPTPTATPTNTPTNTPTPTSTPVCTAPPFYAARAVLINEVAWAGTLASTADEWVELYNTNTSCTVDLNGWHLIGIRSGGVTAFDLSFTNEDDIPAGDYFIIATEKEIFADTTIVDRDMSDRPSSGTFGLIDTQLTLYLYGPDDETVDTANIGTGVPGAWPAGSTSGRRSMERYRNAPDTRTNWVTFNRPSLPPSWPRDRSGVNFINGSPGMANWALEVTVTPSPVPTVGRTPTARPPTPFPHMVINEFLPRAGSDWNGDGQVNVFDEFIEVKNLGPIDANLEGWKLDDVAGLGSPAFNLPGMVLKPGDRAVFYGLTTRILLEDSGDTVRLINPQGAVIDGRTYGVTETLDVSHCRIPDGYYWRTACFATPGNENALTGVAPVPAPIVLGKPAPCLLPDTAPEPFLQAECQAYGEDMWDRTFWDEPGAAVFIVEGGHTKWKTSIE